MVIILVFCAFTTSATRWQQQFVSIPFKLNLIHILTLTSIKYYAKSNFVTHSSSFTLWKREGSILYLEHNSKLKLGI